MNVDLVTKDDFKAHFYRDFKYGVLGECQDTITDEDIDKAFVEAKMNFNEGLWHDQAELKVALLYATAHYMVLDIQAAKEGVNSSSSFPVSSRSVGSVSESYQVPEWISKYSYLAHFASTRYGLKYCSMLRPRMVGNVAVYQGATTF
jgi:hypothetical protein